MDCTRAGCQGDKSRCTSCQRWRWTRNVKMSTNPTGSTVGKIVAGHRASRRIAARFLHPLSRALSEQNTSSVRFDGCSSTDILRSSLPPPAEECNSLRPLFKKNIP